MCDESQGVTLPDVQMVLAILLDELLGPNGGICAGPECNYVAHRDGLCLGHYGQRKRSGELKPLRKYPDEHECGTLRKYALGCHCGKCRAANARQRKALWENRRKRPASEVPHGDKGYWTWGCRCDVCKPAGKARNDAAYAKIKAGAGRE